jgi:hypothetical protein
MSDTIHDSGLPRGDSTRVPPAPAGTQGAEQDGASGCAKPSYWACVRGLVENKRDLFGSTVTDIYAVTNKFTVYTVRKRTDGSDRVRHALCDDYEEAAKLRKRLAPVAPTMALIDDLMVQPPRFAWFGHTRRRLWARKLGICAWAMEMAFENNIAAAHAILHDFRSELESRRDSRNRMRYVLAGICAIAVMGCLWVLLSAAPSNVAWLAPLREAGAITLAGGVKAIDVLAFGALGAFFSVSLDVQRVRVGHAITIWEMLYTGFARILIGVIAAAVVILLIEANWVLAGGPQDASEPASVYLFGFIAGFSEMFVPSALKNGEHPRPLDREPGTGLYGREPLTLHSPHALPPGDVPLGPTADPTAAPAIRPERHPPNDADLDIRAEAGARDPAPSPRPGRRTANGTGIASRARNGKKNGSATSGPHLEGPDSGG